MKKLVKNNIPLILGITLPIIVIIIFAIAQYLPQYFVNPPNEKILFATGYYESTNDQYKNYDIDIKDGNITISYRKLKYTRQKPELFIFDPVNKNITEIKYILPIVQDNKWHQINIPEFKNIKIDNNKTSKDGYTFHKNRSDNFNILGLFFNTRNKSDYVISKDGYLIPIESNKYDNFYNIYFMGWIENDN